MGRSQESFQKKEVRKKKEKKRKDKEKKKLERKDSGSAKFDDMIVYVDENGMLTDTPPDTTRKVKTDASEIEVSVPRMDPNGPSRKSKTGRLTFFNEIKGYGFINESTTGQSVFVHINDLQGDIKKGDLVSFEIEKGQRGPAATQVKLVK
ncbi:MAG: cold shock domain-containing protein [Bacteroides sp.]|nr:cold shock domain-containing protein [Bacteroides sp.]